MYHVQLFEHADEIFDIRRSLVIWDMFHKERLYSLWLPLCNVKTSVSESSTTLRFSNCNQMLHRTQNAVNQKYAVYDKEKPNVRIELVFPDPDFAKTLREKILCVDHAIPCHLPVFKDAESKVYKLDWKSEDEGSRPDWVAVSVLTTNADGECEMDVAYLDADATDGVIDCQSLRLAFSSKEDDSSFSGGLTRFLSPGTRPAAGSRSGRYISTAGAQRQGSGVRGQAPCPQWVGEDPKLRCCACHQRRIFRVCIPIFHWNCWISYDQEIDTGLLTMATSDDHSYGWECFHKSLRCSPRSNCRSAGG